MAGLRWTAKSAEVASGTSNLTLLQVVAPTNQRLRVLGFGFSWKGDTHNQEGVECQVLTQSTAGTAGALTLVKLDESLSETIQATAQETFSAEPTAGAVKWSRLTHQMTGVDYIVPESWEWVVAGGDRLGMRIIAPGVTEDVVAYLIAEE